MRKTLRLASSLEVCRGRIMAAQQEKIRSLVKLYNERKRIKIKTRGMGSR